MCRWVQPDLVLLIKGKDEWKTNESSSQRVKANDWSEEKHECSSQSARKVCVEDKATGALVRVIERKHVRVISHGLKYLPLRH